MLKKVGQFGGMVLGTVLSPTWPLLLYALEPYFNLHHATQTPYAMLLEIEHFRQVAQLYPTEVMCQLIPTLVLILLFGMLFISLMAHLGGRFTIMISNVTASQMQEPV